MKTTERHKEEESAGVAAVVKISVGAVETFGGKADTVGKDVFHFAFGLITQQYATSWHPLSHEAETYG